MLLRNVLVSVWLLAFPAVGMAETRVDIDRTKDFSRYTTFSVEVSPPVRNGEVDEHNTIAVNRQHRAMTSALRARGLTPADGEADLTVRVANREDERMELVSFGSPYPYGWYGPWGYGYGGYLGAPYWGGDVWTYRFHEGTTTVDVIERATGDLVYRAEVTAEVDDDEDDLDHDAVRIARKAFKKFPARGIYVD
jgi:hypothetical protein